MVPFIQTPADFFRAFETLNIDLRHRERQPRSSSSSDSDGIKHNSLHARSNDDGAVTSTAAAAAAVADTADTAALAYGGMTFVTNESLAGCSCISPKQTCHIDFWVRQLWRCSWTVSGVCQPYAHPSRAVCRVHHPWWPC